MNFAESIKFVNNWLWNSKNRETKNLPWLNEYVRDAARMVRDAIHSRKISDTVESPDSGKERQPCEENNNESDAIALLMRVDNFQHSGYERAYLPNELTDDIHKFLTQRAHIS